MGVFDIKKRKISISQPEHSKHKLYLQRISNRVTRLFWWRKSWSLVLTIIFVSFFGISFWHVSQANLSWNYEQQSEFQKIRAYTLARYSQLPVKQVDPKTEEIRTFLAERKSPLVEYAGEIARMDNWKLILGIAQAESNLCKKTDKNNCWGIGPGKPFVYDDIKSSLYHADYLIEKYGEQGMTQPETMVRTYVGYHNPTWIEAIQDVFYDLEVRGL
ncbi:MAG: hypothetical protein COT91_00790 [Candidatus Doudnabacteria bacterium CG10_big_fil_rev_8_21_14_0_10_41_10]|uniref:Uncharacterized protein n=1 Tax=Candidatus Doudnabacteria bacterium CG10_big_fil_rev_8_21_14_0_10_41_10 TaxID=1974551 RepID=A0A2H0VGX9_9BACT|nr:MAG: hypothetical protein COT91_00790 [Candidatus Doudnabacteria bacterium CG10_big_fil_rev_8_21_14_0_10_41_10]